MQALDRVLETVLYAEDLAAAERFYSGVLGLELKLSDPNFRFYRCGGAMLLIFDPRNAGQPEIGIPSHGAHGQGHMAFAVAASELPAWRERLAKHGVAIESEHTWETTGCHSIYFRDPAGNSIELAQPAMWGL